MSTCVARRNIRFRKDESHRLVEDYLRWEIVINTGESIVEAIELERRFGLSFWDALIVQAANVSGSDAIYTEDFNHGQTYGTVQATNPFLV